MLILKPYILEQGHTQKNFEDSGSELLYCGKWQRVCLHGHVPGGDSCVPGVWTKKASLGKELTGVC